MTKTKVLTLDGLRSFYGKMTAKIDEKLATKVNSSDLHNVAKTGNYEDLENKPVFSTATSKKTARIVIGTSAAGYTTDDVDYLCDGTDDQNKINTAIKSLPINGGEIKILDGVYNITSPISIIEKDNIRISGSGKSTQLKRMWDSDTVQGVFTLTGATGIYLSDLFINNNETEFESLNNRDLHYDNGSGKDLILSSLYGLENKNGSSFGELGKLQRAVRNGNAKDLFPIGTIIPDTWKDPQTGTVHQAPFIVAHYGDCELANGTTKKGVYLIRKTVLPFTLQFDAKESGNSDYSRRDYGNNRYAHSAIHQYLNSDKTKNTWWEKKHQYDVAPDYASARDGYLKGCSYELLTTVSEVKVDTQAAMVDNSVIDKVPGRFFLPSLENLNFSTGGNDKPSTGVEGPVWEYYKTGSPSDSANNKRIFDFAGLSSFYVWLRSPYRSNSSSVHNVSTDGSRNLSSAYNSYAVAPACFIC